MIVRTVFILIVLVLKLFQVFFKFQPFFCSKFLQYPRISIKLPLAIELNHYLISYFDPSPGFLTLLGFEINRLLRQSKGNSTNLIRTYFLLKLLTIWFKNIIDSFACLCGLLFIIFIQKLDILQQFLINNQLLCWLFYIFCN
jgi:hypothetical protein